MIDPKNYWERAVGVWDRFIADYPGHKGGVYTDAVEGAVWVFRAGSVVEVNHETWRGRFHIREPRPEQQTLELGA